MGDQADQAKVKGAQAELKEKLGAKIAGKKTYTYDSSDKTANYHAIARFLTDNGYSNAAAAGIVSCIAGEDPEADPEKVQNGFKEDNPKAGIGLIQWTPQSDYPGLKTGDAQADFNAQLSAILEFNKSKDRGKKAGNIDKLNAITDPVEAAKFYSENFESPKVTDSDVREKVAKKVYEYLTK